MDGIISRLSRTNLLTYITLLVYLVAAKKPSVLFRYRNGFSSYSEIQDFQKLYDENKDFQNFVKDELKWMFLDNILLY